MVTIAAHRAGYLAAVTACALIVLSACTDEGAAPVAIPPSFSTAPTSKAPPNTKAPSPTPPPLVAANPLGSGPAEMVETRLDLLAMPKLPRAPRSGNAITALAAVSPTRAWAMVGHPLSTTHALIWDGENWTATLLPDRSLDALALSASGTANAWAAAGATVLRFDNGRWRDAPRDGLPDTLYITDVLAADRLDAIVVGRQGQTPVVARWNGRSWHTEHLPDPARPGVIYLDVARGGPKTGLVVSGHVDLADGSSVPYLATRRPTGWTSILLPRELTFFRPFRVGARRFWGLEDGEIIGWDGHDRWTRLGSPWRRSVVIRDLAIAANGTVLAVGHVSGSCNFAPVAYRYRGTWSRIDLDQLRLPCTETHGASLDSVVAVPGTSTFLVGGSVGSLEDFAAFASPLAFRAR